MGMPVFIMPVFIALLVLGIALGIIGIILYITGLRNNAKSTMVYGCWVLAGAFLCFYFIHLLFESYPAVD